jgi:dihydroneopterin aldolase
MDMLSIRDLKISCIVGVHSHERKREQDLFLDVDLWLDFHPAAASDHLQNTIDYTTVADDITEFIRAEKFQLIETLAQRACERLLRMQTRLQRCRLVIRKPAAVPNALCAMVTVERERERI